MKNLITYLKTLWSRVSGLESTVVSLDCRLTVGSPSFHRRSTMLKLVSVLVLILTLGVGNAWGDPVTIFQETFGDNGDTNTAVASATCYTANTSMFTSGHQTTVAENYSSAGKVGKNSVQVSDNTGASGSSAVWFQASKGTSTKTLFQVQNINISGYSSLSLKFNLKRSTGTSAQNAITVKYQIDSNTERTLTYTVPSNDSWTWCTGDLTGTGSSLRITFSMATTGGYMSRLDDIILTGTEAASGWKLKGSFDSWGDGYAMTGSGTVSVTRSLAANTRYEFKIYDGATAYGNNGAIVHSISDWTFATDKNNCVLYTGPAGDYTFSINTSTKATSVTYPSVTHPNANYVYIKKGAGWSDARIYNYQSGSDSKMSDWGGSPILASCEICDETYYYGAAYFNKIIFRDGGSNQSNEMSLDRGKWLDETTHADSWSNFVKYSITFHGNSNTGGSMTDVTGICPNDSRTLVTNGYSRTGYDFTGWNTQAGGGGTSYANLATISSINADIDLYAQWSAQTISITLDKNNNDASGSSSGSTSIKYDATAVLSSPTHATRTGYTLEGYYAESGCTHKVMTSAGALVNYSGYVESGKWVRTTTPTTLYANWTIKTPNITWSANGTDWSGGTHGNPSTSVNYGGKIATFPTSPAAGQCDGSKEFVGWTLTPIVGTTNTKPTFVSPQTTITQEENFTLYAVFATRTANSYSLGDINDLINGKNVIVYNANQSRAMASSIQATGKLNALAVTFNSTNISSPDAALIWTIYNSGTKYIFKSGNNYLRVTSNSANTKLTCDGTSDTWTITEASTGVYSLYSTAGSSTYPLEAYYSSPNYFFTSYKGSGVNWNMKFYVPTYSAYQTACSSDPVLNVTPTSLDFGNVANGTYKELTFSLTGSYLTANASIGVSGTNSSYFSVTPSSVAKGTGTIAATDITVRYTPGAVGDGHTATVTVSSTGADNKTVTLTGNCKASYTVTCSPASNGSVLADKTSNVMSGETVTLTITPSSGYQLSSISAVDGSSNPVSLTGTGNSRTFTMPASNVTVTATFVIRTDYVLVESALDDYSGEYLIAYRSSGTETLNVLSGRYNSKNSNTYGTYTNVWSYYDSGAKAIESNATTDAMKMVVEPGNISGRYTIYFANDNTYLAMTTGNKSTGTYLRFNENITSGYEYDWDFSWNTSSSVSEVAIHNNAASEGDKKWLWLLYNTGSPRFALYTSGADIELYKKVETCTKLDAPTGLTASSITQTTVTLSWNSVSNASGYEISLNNGSSWTSTSTNTSYNATGLTAGTTYNWKVRATGTGDYCAAGNAASSTVTMKNAVKVTYKTNGATGGQLPVAGGVVNLTEGDSHTILGNTGSGGSPTPLTKTGYVFDGWHSSSTYSSTPAYTIGSSITVNSNVDIYANWKPKKDTFVDAVHNTATQYGEGANYTIPSCDNQTRYTSGTCEETHYKFIGWALAGADLTNPSNIIHAGDTQTASGTDANPKTYYAVWAEEL